MILSVISVNILSKSSPQPNKLTIYNAKTLLLVSKSDTIFSIYSVQH